MRADSTWIPTHRLRCFVCGELTDDPRGWAYRIRQGKYAPVCPNCTQKTREEVSQQTSHPNLGGAIALGLVAAALGAVGWYGMGRLALAGGGGGVWIVTEMLAIGGGLLVGKSVVLGSGNKRGVQLQYISGLLSFVPLLGGRYLLINYLLRSQPNANFTGWLALGPFVARYMRVLLHGAIIVDLPFLAFATTCAVALPIEDKLVSKLPPWARQ